MKRKEIKHRGTEDHRGIQIAFLCASLCLCISIPVFAEDHPGILVVLGAEGTPEFGKQFKAAATEWESAAKKADEKILVLGSDATDKEKTDKSKLERTLKDTPKESAQPYWLILIGHGTYDGKRAKFNLRGPDVTAAEFAEWLRPFERPVVIINCASSSAPFIRQLSGPDRVIITATKSGYEMNVTRFAPHMAKAIGDATSDLDKDGQTSVLEAWLFASRAVADSYKLQARLATEHSLLDDNGDELATPAEWFRGVRATKKARGDSDTDGLRAHQIHLIRSARERAMPDNIRKKRDALEIKIIRLRENRGELSDDAYYAALEPMLVELAKLYEDAESSDDAPKKDDALRANP
jgi:hypothetical protein